MDAPALAKLFESAVFKTIGKKTAVAFSGGLDSAAIATIAKQNGKIELITVGIDESHDILAAKETAKELGLELNIILLDKKIILKDYSICWKIMPGTLTEMELMAGAYECCKKAKELGCDVILFGSGAEELFIGYSKYFEAKEKKMDLEKILADELATLPERDLKRTAEVAKHFGMEARYPLMDKDLIEAVTSISVKERMGTLELKKPLLRKMAKLLGVPKCAYERRKKAMQYGSGIHRIMLEMMRKKTIEPQKPKPPFKY